jgi:glycosyltransferase involved in cell wall biosynthesis
MSKTEYSPKVTVAIVFYNAMPHFRSAVGSVLSQDFADWELLLIDDGSTDGSVEFARSIADPRVRVFADGRNLKLNIRLNQSIELARGEFYFRMDADDIMFPWRLRKQLEVLAGLDSNVVLGAAAVCIDKGGKILGLRRGLAPVRSIYAARHALIHPTVCARTEWFRRNKYSEEFVFHRSQDAELWTRCFRHTRLMQLEEPLLFYRESLSIGVENYIGSCLGLCIIAYRCPSLSGPRRALWMGSSLLRCWIVCVLASSGVSKYLVKRRNSRLQPDELDEYEQLIRSLR